MNKYYQTIIKYSSLSDGSDFSEQMVNSISFALNNFQTFGYTHLDRLVANRLNWLYLHVEETKPILEKIKSGADYKTQLKKLCSLILKDNFIYNQNKKNGYKTIGSIANSVAIF